jgi:hypothetical protein
MNEDNTFLLAQQFEEYEQQMNRADAERWHGKGVAKKMMQKKMSGFGPIYGGCPRFSPPLGGFSHVTFGAPHWVTGCHRMSLRPPEVT